MTNNTRFLIPSWVQVPHPCLRRVPWRGRQVASHVLGLIARRICSDWQAKYGHPVYALETFVDRSRFKVRVDAQQLLIEQLQKKVSDLEDIVARLSKNFSNSSKPPSSDIIRPKSKHLPKGKRKIGAQPGHPRHERPLFSEAEIDKFHDYRLDACPECNNPDIVFLDQYNLIE